MNIGKLHLLLGQQEEATATLRLSTNESYTDIMSSETPWDINWYSSIISRSYDLGQAAYAQQQDVNRIANMQAGFAAGLLAYDHIVADNENLKSLAPDVALKVGKMQYMTGKLQIAITSLQSILNEDFSDPVNREIARWYLGVMQRSGNQDQTLYDKLITADPAEAAQIEEIANMQL